MSTNDDDEAVLNAIIARSNRLTGRGPMLRMPVSGNEQKHGRAPAARAKGASRPAAKSASYLTAPTLPLVPPERGRARTNLAMSSVEVCAGAGGQALGLEHAGFDHQALVEIDPHCCATLKANRPQWNVVQADLRAVDGKAWRGVDLFAGGLPCPPFSVAGKQLGDQDERNLFPAALRLADEMRPRAIMIENVRGFLDPVFQPYREELKRELRALGYHTDWRLFNAADFGVSQLRPRVAIVALRTDIASNFEWPHVRFVPPVPVGELLYDLMSARGWRGAGAWRKRANGIAPTIVGGSLKHGGPDLGPTRARNAWAQLGVDGKGLVDDAPERDFEGMPRLTVRMVARIQGFPDEWAFTGRKTAAYRQVGNAFPPPVARAVAENIRAALSTRRIHRVA